MQIYALIFTFQCITLGDVFLFNQASIIMIH